jgi:hypothetical protein
VRWIVSILAGYSLVGFLPLAEFRRYGKNIKSTRIILQIMKICIFYYVVVMGLSDSLNVVDQYNIIYFIDKVIFVVAEE